MTTTADWFTAIFTGVAGIATAVAATMAFCTWRTYQKMTAILGRTNEINARMVEETRIARLGPVAPILRISPERIHSTSDSETGVHYWAIGLLKIHNEGPGDAFDLDFFAKFTSTRPSIPELKAGERASVENLLLPLYTVNPSEIEISINYRDRMGNQWEVEYKRGTSRARLYLEMIHEAVSTDLPPQR